PSKVVANIPYNITTPLVWRFLEQLSPLGTDYFLLMVQREAAERMVAPPRTKARFPLGITLELMGGTSIIRTVSPRSFRPVPSVLSALIEVVLTGIHADLPNDPLWRSLLRAGFSHRRKKLANNLSVLHPARDWDNLLGQAKIAPNARAEELTCDQWIELWRLAAEIK
ncbi:MAG: rRNA adenine N-6-methyltransferase family protein, partial [Synergistota bacterium]|nr:rRNA adenine N-6-methyltransferase family protein [Synergistota bacterium]